jgi:hypothetical protein
MKRELQRGDRVSWSNVYAEDVTHVGTVYETLSTQVVVQCDDGATRIVHNHIVKVLNKGERREA